MRYQHQLTEALRVEYPHLLAEPWIEFYDAVERRHASPDVVLLQPERTILIEAKLGYRTTGWMQLESLYQPLAEFLWGKPTVLVLAVKHPKWMEPTLDGDLAAVGQLSEGRHLLHWMP
jgi:hypothetical protein